MQTDDSPNQTGDALHWVSTSQAAAALKVSERTIQRRAAKGQITARKVTNSDGEKWEVLVAVPTGAAIATPASADSGAIGDDTTKERERASVALASGGSGATLPTGAAIGDDAGETAFLRAQLEAMNDALKREQSAHEQTRQLLAGALQMASRQLPNVTPEREQSAAPDDAATPKPDAMKSATKRKARPLWRAMLGLR